MWLFDIAIFGKRAVSRGYIRVMNGHHFCGGRAGKRRLHASRNNDTEAARRRREEGNQHAPAWLGIEVRHLAALRAIADARPSPVPRRASAIRSQPSVNR